MLRLHVVEGDVVEKELLGDGLWRLGVRCQEQLRAALLYDPPLPKPDLGDRVVLNTAAVDLGLGTGGWDFVLHVVGKQPGRESARGHTMKLRYTPWQMPLLAVEEEDSPFHETMKSARDVGGMPVVVIALHSQLAPAAAALRDVLGREARLIYVMTDDAALPLLFSETVPRLKRARLLDGVVTAGNAFGGDAEAVTTFSGLLAARHVLKATASIIGPGPGMAGTGNAFGTTALHAGFHAEAVCTVGGRPVVAPRISFADRRARHQGISHHTLTAFGLVARSRCTVVLPTLSPEQRRIVTSQTGWSPVAARHRIVTEGRGEDALTMLKTLQIPLQSMGRDESTEGPLFLAAAAAGYVAADMVRSGCAREADQCGSRRGDGGSVIVSDSVGKAGERC